MIDVLRRHFMVTFMSFFSVLLVAMLLYVYISSAYTMSRDSYKILTAEMDRYGNDYNVPARRAGVSFFSVGIDQDAGAVEPKGDIFLQEDEMLELVKTVMNRGDGKGELSEFHIRYIYSPRYRRLFIVDTTYEDQSLLSLRFMLLVLGLFTIIVFYFLSRYFTNMAVVPVKKAWKAQNQFVSNASHELKTPLTIIMANNDMLAESEDKNSEQNRQRISLISVEAARMKVLVEEILFLARSDENTHNLRRSDCNLSDLVTGSILMFESVAFEAGIEMSYQIQSGLKASVVKEHIKRLVIILMDNAIKYTPSGESVHVSLKHLDHNRNQLTVQNTGVHIRDEDIEHIFNRFYKSSAGDSSDSGSFGLGLSIAAKICEDHDGRISVTSSEDKGVIFKAEF